jgi:hypothetical protein
MPWFRDEAAFKPCLLNCKRMKVLLFLSRRQNLPSFGIAIFRFLEMGACIVTPNSCVFMMHLRLEVATNELGKLLCKIASNLSRDSVGFLTNRSPGLDVDYPCSRVYTYWPNFSLLARILDTLLLLVVFLPDSLYSIHV